MTALPAATPLFAELAALKNPPQGAIDAATCIVKLARNVDDPTEFRRESIDGFNPHLDAMKRDLVAATMSGTADAARTFLRTVETARSYCFDHFAPDHGVLMLTYDMMLAVARMAGLDLDTEWQRIRDEQDSATGTNATLPAA